MMMMIRRWRDRPGISASGGQAVNRTDLDQEAEGSLPTVQLRLVLHYYTIFLCQEKVKYGWSVKRSQNECQRSSSWATRRAACPECTCGLFYKCKQSAQEGRDAQLQSEHPSRAKVVKHPHTNGVGRKVQKCNT